MNTSVTYMTDKIILRCIVIPLFLRKYPLHIIEASFLVANSQQIIFEKLGESGKTSAPID